MSTALTGCQGLDQMGTGQKTGTVAGGVGGGVIGAYVGQRLGGRGGMVLGGLLGTVIGAALGNAIGKAYDDREKQVETIRQQQKVEIDTEAVEVLPKAEAAAAAPAVDEAQDARDRSVYVAHVVAAEHFTVGSAAPTEAGRKVYEALADAYNAQNKRSVLVVGHTDSSGDAQANQALSEARARAVAKIFVERGFSAERIYIQGAGEAEPIASNDTAEGRAHNRRVEIVDGASGTALANYKQMRLKAIEKTASQAQVAKAQPQSPSPRPTVTAPPRLEPEKVRLPSGSIDFGGIPLRDDRTPLANAQLTAAPKGGLFGGLFVKEAQASVPVQPFLADGGLQGGTITNLADSGKTLFTSDDCAPGYYRQPFYARVGQHFVSISPLSLLSNWVIGEPASAEVYVNYDHRNRNKAPDAVLKGQARSYELDNGVLYRWRAAENNQGIVGVELLLPKLDKAAASKLSTIDAKAKIYYVNRGEVFVKDTELQAKVVTVEIKGAM